MNEERKRVILCVDDEQPILRMLDRLLSREGYAVLTAASGEAGLEVLTTNPVDLVISDQRMPGLSGWEFLRQVRKTYPNVMRIMISGYSDFESLVGAVNEGEIFRFISKPWEHRQFLETVRLALARQDVVGNIENVIRNVCQLASLADKVTLDTMSDTQSLILQIGEKQDNFPPEIIFRFLEILLQAFGVKTTPGTLTGQVTKEDGLINITLDIGKGVMLKIRLPRMKTESPAS